MPYMRTSEYAPSSPMPSGCQPCESSGLFNIKLVAPLFGGNSPLSLILDALAGLSALYSIHLGSKI